MACGQSTFSEMADEMASDKIPVIHSNQIDSSYVILDSREWAEFNVSHLPGAIWIGYNQPKFDVLDSIDQSKKIVVYCSVGYRSGKIAEKIAGRGFVHVYNLWGGIFDWVNNGNAVVNDEGSTAQVHAYSKKWGKWLYKGDKVYE
jgi:rhodanese-related sulfurtransferase